jgi:hypothetical protein
MTGPDLARLRHRTIRIIIYIIYPVTNQKTVLSRYADFRNSRRGSRLAAVCADSVGFAVTSFCAYYALLIAIVYLLTRNSTDHDAFAVTCLGCTVGTFPALIIALPQAFSAEFGSERAAVAALEEIDALLRFRGYRKKDDASTAAVLYTSRLPAALSWKENSFSICLTRKSVSIRGPKGSVTWLRNRLIRSTTRS